MLAGRISYTCHHCEKSSMSFGFISERCKHCEMPQINISEMRKSLMVRLAWHRYSTSSEILDAAAEDGTNKYYGIGG